MAQLIQFNEDGDVECSNCEVIFSVVWHRNGWTDRVEYCPFCGDEVEEREQDKSKDNS